ncbi:NUDIX hydrolase [Virgisporangium aurantiacum]|uniref:7,8-dihydro-8-oxoguanine triphosphatase n=1 Tax=Virgisporangium aurantiacum TaxID=175570 RepID=A0A8J4E1Z0_9ACTN|nr:8-oxo-dGTP diphosphatase [Virgisporangium aurantiacum]GIJ59275.1 7,8-dihydro-8-oxoguanine triphosphatase [Virgisporangium aurantiacum]
MTEDGGLQAVIATLGYVLSADGREVLMLHRNSRTDDYHYGKYNGLGGKVEPTEDVCAGMRREVAEEAGITAVGMDLAGTVSWPGFGRDGEAWLGFIFRIRSWTGTPLTRCAEGTLEWVAVADLLAGRFPVWEGDRNFLPLVFAGKTFHGVMPYANGRPLSWTYSQL